jgi:dTDP-4-amino-4,6-dideoxygalactose transaminase
MIPVTKPFLPDLDTYQAYVRGIWERRHLTNNGPLVQELEAGLKQHLGIENLLFLGNGTIAIQIAIKALGLTGEVITTPFSYVATTSSLVWEGCEPVFVDIDPQTLNIDPSKIEAAITPRTSGILATHVFGNPCDIDAIQAIADKHGLKVIYDAAHCFGTMYKGRSVFAYGDVSTTSFHATKLFHTTEGGAVFTPHADVHYRMKQMRNFGHAGFDKYDGVGINGKNSEFHAAMGLCNLPHIEAILASRKDQCDRYVRLLTGVPVQHLTLQADSDWNHSYYPVVFRSEEEMFRVKAALEAEQIFPRRYFYPSLSAMDYVSAAPTPISDSIASRILCLPMYDGLTEGDQERVGGVVQQVLKGT